MCVVGLGADMVQVLFCWAHMCCSTRLFRPLQRAGSKGGWNSHGVTSLLCFLTPVKLYSEVCVYVLVPYTQNKTSCLRRHFPCSPGWSRLPPHPHPSLSFISEEEGDREVFGVWSPEGREGGASESSSSHLFLLFKMEA